jgi:DNA-binding transcriptional LysR family regulator
VTGMQVFVKVAATGSFSAAARSLSLSQTMITKHITGLEERLGVQLFQRSTRRMSLTEAGRLFLEGSQKLLADIAEIEETVSAERREPRGTLRINAPVSFAIRHLGPILPEFSHRFPLVTIQLELNDRSVDLIEERWDLALRILPMTSSTLRSRKLASIRMVVCAAPSYLAARGTPKTIDDLRHHNCLGYTLSQRVGVSLWSFGRDAAHTVDIGGNLQANNGDVMREAALAGQGIIYQPTFIVAEELRQGTLSALTLDHPTLDSAELHAVFGPGGTIPLKTRAMIDYLVECYGPDAPWDRP